MSTLASNSTAPQERRRKARYLPVKHWHNLLWWLALVSVFVVVQQLPSLLTEQMPPPVTSVPTEKNAEKEAFIALVFGRVSTSNELAISESSFKSQLQALKQAGYSSVRLSQINSWKQASSLPLPAKPLLLSFEDANRETMEIVDKMLLAQGMTALVFVDVNKLNEGNIQLVSWHQLEKMVKSGRWEVGISGCPNENDQAFTSSEILAKKFSTQRELLERRLKTSVVTVDCSRAWSANYKESSAAWNQALKDASLQLGFVTAPIGANYLNDSEFNFKRIRVSKSWGQAGLLSQLKSHEPRRTAFVDQFKSDQPGPEWVTDSGELTVERGALKITNHSGEQGALVTLAGTEKWQDADVEVSLKERPDGQFWMFLRYGTGQPFVRLGIAEGQVKFQESGAAGVTKQLASQDLPANEISLRLRVIGSRAIAYLNGKPLLARPVEVPQGSDHGSFALAVWNDTNVVNGGVSSKSSAYLTQVKASPLFQKGAIVAPDLGKVSWSQLQQQSELLSVISPHYFSWTGGTPKSTQASDTTMVIFANYHHLKLLPALTIDESALLSDKRALTEQVLAWASNPAYQGVNLVISKSMLGEAWQQFQSELNQRMGKIGKQVMMTLLDSKEQFIPTDKNDQPLLVDSYAELLPAEPRILYPSNSELLF